MIDPTKKYRTRNGREVRIYATDAGGRFPVHGAVRDKDGWFPDEWTSKGFYSGERDGFSTPHDIDLIEVRPRIRREVWVNVYPDLEPSIFVSKQSADWHAVSSRIACVKLVIDCEEGEGL